MKKTSIKKVSDVAHSKMCFSIEWKFYEQLDGIPMRSQIAPLLANVCMNWIINESKKFDIRQRMFYRYIDDCFDVFSTKQEVQKFYES